MKRRTFIEKSLLGIGVGAVALSGLASAETSFVDANSSTGTSPATSVTVQQVQDYLRGMGAKWIPITSKQTVDTIKSGDPSMKVTGIATAWMGYLDTIKKTHEAGCNLLIVHEPLYYTPRDREPKKFALEGAKRKQKLLEETGIAVIRCHDVWDRVAGIGICDAWAKFLGLEKEINRPSNFDPSLPRPFYVAYEVEPTKASDLAAAVAAKLTTHGQNNVLLLGPKDKIVRSVAVGTGAVTSFNNMVSELNVDLTICTDDGFTFWRDGALAIDMNYPVIIVSHSSSEEIGMQRMAEHLTKVFPQVSVQHLAGKCMFQQIPAINHVQPVINR